MKKLAIYLLLAAMVLTLVACQEDPPATQTPTYAFTTNAGLEIAIDANVAPILSALGEWREYAESASCAFEGLDKVYTYSGFEIQTYPMGEQDFVYAIVLYDDTVTTDKGIHIGSTAADVTAAYGTPEKETATAITYNGEGMTLQFLLRDGTVTSIQYTKA